MKTKVDERYGRVGEADIKRVRLIRNVHSNRD